MQLLAVHQTRAVRPMTRFEEIGPALGIAREVATVPVKFPEVD